MTKHLDRKAISDICRRGKVPVMLEQGTKDKLASIIDLDINIERLKASREPLGLLPARRAQLVDSVMRETYGKAGAIRHKANIASRPSPFASVEKATRHDDAPDLSELADRFFKHRARAAAVSITAEFCGDPMAPQRRQVADVVMREEFRFPRSCMCQWPSDDATGSTVFVCSEARVPGKAYCATHYARSRAKTEPARGMIKARDGKMHEVAR